MINLTPDYEQRKLVVQPQFTRSRIASRSPIQSEVMNRSSDQLSFDYENVRGRLNNLRSEMEAIFLTLRDGGDSVTASATVYPMTEEIFASALTQLAARVDAVSDRLRVLETKEGL